MSRYARAMRASFAFGLAATSALALGALGCGGGGGGGGSGAGGGGGGGFGTGLPPPVSGQVDYDVVYVRQPRVPGQNMTWPEVFHPCTVEPGSDLVLRHPDGSEDVLVTAGVGAVTDPFVSFDAQWVFYTFFPDVSSNAINTQRGLPYGGSDVWKVAVGTKQKVQLTHGEFTPNTGAGTWDETNPVDPAGNVNRLGYGVLNMGPCPVAGGRVAFTSNRNGFIPPKGYTNPCLQLFVMDDDGSNVQCIAPLNVGSALHPAPMVDGRILFSSYESQGLRDQRMWGLWSIQPDGRAWKPVVSAFHEGQAFHFATQLTGGDVVVVDYYNLNNDGFGALFRMPASAPAGTPSFHSAFLFDNPDIDQTVGDGFPYPFRMPFTPYGFHAITAFTHPQDEAAPVISGGTARVGKFTHPSAAPAGDLLVAWSPGPCNLLDRPTTKPAIDSGIYLAPGGVVNSLSDLRLIVDDAGYDEAWPRAVVPWSRIHGVAEPPALPWLPNDGSVRAELPAGTPYGLVGTSSVWKRESFPGIVSGGDTYDGLDVFNTYENGQSGNWFTQGAEAGKYTNADVYAIRLLAMEPNSHRSYGPDSGQQFTSHANERLRILGEVPLEKKDGSGATVLDPDGNPDTSFLVRIPADTPFTFQTLDKRGMVLNMAQTWHQVRPGEMRADCGGCHAHSQAPMRFEDTAASRPGYHVYDLSKTTPLLSADASGNTIVNEAATSVVDVEFLRDVRPILQRSCATCHTKNVAAPPGKLVLDDIATQQGVPGDYYRLAADSDGQFGIPSLVQPYGWRQTNASRYVRMFQSRRSLLVWKVFGQRLDGWTNADHPTESTLGDAGTLPAGANVNDADIDYTGSIMPPPNSGVPALSEDEKRTIARWIDLGCPLDFDAPGTTPSRGWFCDDLKPCLTVSSPRPGPNAAPLSLLRIGAVDADSGLDATSLQVTADFAVAGRPAGAALADLFSQTGDGIWTYTLPTPLASGFAGTLRASVRDRQGNVTRVAVKFTTE